MNETAHPKTILIIDDEEIIRQSLCDQLEDLGYRVLTAEDGRAGMELIERERPELILTDLRMPEMGGLEVIKRSKELASNIPIIVISGAGRIDDAVEALRLGAYDYLTKPVNDPNVLQHTVNKAPYSDCGTGGAQGRATGQASILSDKGHSRKSGRRERGPPGPDCLGSSGFALEPARATA